MELACNMTGSERVVCVEIFAWRGGFWRDRKKTTDILGREEGDAILGKKERKIDVLWWERGNIFLGSKRNKGIF